MRFEHVMNAYLGLTVAAKTLASVCQSIDGVQLQTEVAELSNQLAVAESSLRSVLAERRRLLQTQLDRLPKLSATLKLLHARVDSIGYQLRNIESQVLAFREATCTRCSTTSSSATTSSRTRSPS